MGETEWILPLIKSMKNLRLKFMVALGLMIFSQMSGAYPCPDRLSTDEELRSSIAWLQKFTTTEKLGECELEITVCNPNEVSRSALFAEVFLIDRMGREIYLPLTVEFNDRSPTYTIQNKRVFHYQKRDRFFEDELGRLEVYRLELLTQWSDPHRLKRLELGAYATNRRLSGPGRNRSRWFICQE